MKTTKKAFLSSLLALLLCITMFMGTTFAWFTDSVTSSGNKIVAGSLKVDLEVLDEKLGVWYSIKNDQDPIFFYDKWEPGYTDVTFLKVENEGTLALKWEARFISDAAVSKLAEVIDVYVLPSETELSYANATRDLDGWTKVGTLDQFINTLSQTTYGSLDAGKCAYLGIALHMQEDAGNEYQGIGLEAFDIKVVATQLAKEEDSFGPDYDEDAKWPELPEQNTASAPVTLDADGRLTADVTLTSADGSIVATVPAGTKFAQGTSTADLNVNKLAQSGANITLEENEETRSFDVHVQDLADDNTAVISIAIAEFLPVGLNMGNYKLYHVEDTATVEMTLLADGDAPVHNSFNYDPATGDVVLHLASFSEVAAVADTENAWDGKFDYSWYDASKTELQIANADQLAAFGAIVGGMKKVTDRVDGKYTYSEEVIQDSFSGKYIKLVADVNIGDINTDTVDASENGIVFYPIGYWNSEGTYEKSSKAISSGFYTFEGTFDGNGNTISNFYQNTWEMKGDHNWYDATLQYYRDGMGLFGKVYKGTVKNLTVHNFSSDGEIATTGVIAAYADGATFENIAITNCNPRVYNIGNGGIVGCVGWYAKEADLKTTFKNITVDNSNKISALWGSYDVACGGIVGQYYPTSGQSAADYPVNAGIHFENCHVAAQMDVYNDVCANYQYYAYRYTGMLIGSVRENETIDGHVYPKMDGITASGCTVHFGDWNDYYYCELVANSLASYTHDHQFSRLEQVKSVEGTTITPLKGDPFTVPATGRYNYVVVNGEHATENATCYHFVDGKVHNHDDYNGDGVEDYETVNGESIRVENNRHIYLEFNKLVTGYGWGVTSRGLSNLNGVTNLDITQGDHEASVEKFKGIVTELYNQKEYKLGDIFSFVDNGVKLVPGALTVSVENLEENNPVSATIIYDRTNWENSTITFAGIGNIEITIQDYYFCKATTITVNVTARQYEEKFDVVMNNGDFLHRVGNSGTVAIDKLFEAKDGVTVGTVSVTVEAVDNTSASGTYSNNAIQFDGTGVVKVTITDNDYCIPTELYLEVIDAVNATGAMNAKANNVVLLQDAGFSSLTVSNGYALYGNGFTLTCGSDSAALDMGYAFVTLDNGILDNVQIVTPNFDYAVLYKSNMTESGNRSETTDKTRYFNVKSGVMVSGNSQILNSRISGGRAAVNVTSGNCVIDNSRIELGAVASLLVGAANSVTLRDVTLVQEPTASTYDPSKKLMGFSVLMICNSDGDAAPLSIEGTLVQNAWVDEDDSQYVPSAGQSIISGVLSNTEYTHDLDDDGVKESLNLGFAYMPESTTSAVNATTITDNRTNKDTVPYDYAEVSILNGKTYVYSYKYSDSETIPTEYVNTSAYVPNKYSDIITVSYSDTSDGLTTGKSFGTDGWVYELNVDLDNLSGYALDFSKLSMTVNGVTVTDYLVDGSAKPTSPVEVVAGGTIYTLTTTIDGKECTALFKVTGTETTKESPSLVASNYEAALLVGEAGSTFSKDTWHGAAPVLEGIQIKYWSVAEKQYKTITLSDYTPTTAGKQNGTEAVWTYTPDNGDFTLTIKNETAVHSSNSVYAMPVVVNSKLYFIASTSSGLVNYGNSERTIKINYYFNDNNGGEQLKFDYTWSIECADGNTAYDYSDFCDGTSKTFTIKSSNGSGCVTGDTLVTLADGTQKRIDEVTFDDQLLVWDFYEGKYTSATAVNIWNHGYAWNAIIKLTFSDGTVTKAVNEHGYFDATLNEFVMITSDNATDYINHKFVKEDSGSYTTVTLANVEVSIEYIEAYSILTAYYYNFITDRMFSLTSPVIDTNFFMPFMVGENLVFNADKMEEEIEKYGLYEYTDFEGKISYELFETLNIKYLKVAVGKGLITYDQILELLKSEDLL